MGLFVAPFAGNAVGGGGHGIIDPPPPGTDPASGPRSEVDTVNRSPVRLLRTTMNKHKPKFMKIVPPGQQRGTIAPPYAWDALERDDWRFAMEKPSKLKEDDAYHQPSTDVSPYRPLASHREKPKTERLPKLPAPTSAPTSAPDPRHQRVDEIHQEIAALKKELQGLHAKKKEFSNLVAGGKEHIKIKPAGPGPAGHWRGSAAAGYPEPKARVFGGRVESLYRGSLRLLEGQQPSLADLASLEGSAREEKPKPRPSSGQMSPPVQFSTKTDPYRPTPIKGHEDLPNRWLSDRERRAQLTNPAPRGLGSAPPQSDALIKSAPQIASIDSQIKQKTDQVQQLVNELKGLQLQMKQTRNPPNS